MKGKGRILWFLMLLVLSGCMATRFSNVWKDESYQKGPVKNVLVIAILQTPERRKMVEDEMAKQLRTHEVNTVLSYAEFPDKLPGREEVIARLGKLGVDGVFVTRFLETQSKVYGTYSDDYKAALNQWEEPRYYAVPSHYGGESQNYAIMQTGLYDAESKNIIWSSSSETWIVGTDSRLISSFVSTVLKQLSDDKFIR